MLPMQGATNSAQSGQLLNAGYSAPQLAPDMTLTDILNEAASLCANILCDVYSAHHRLVGPMGSAASGAMKSASPEPPPSATSLATTTLNQLREIQVAINVHHSRI